MTVVEKKLNTEYFQAVLDGRKTFELRLNDFDIKESDTLLLKEWDPETKTYTGREVSKVVSYVFKTSLNGLTKLYSQEELNEKGIQIISLK